MIRQLVTALEAANLELHAEEIADALWLARAQGAGSVADEHQSVASTQLGLTEPRPPDAEPQDPAGGNQAGSGQDEGSGGIAPGDTGGTEVGAQALSITLTKASALPEALELGRALRPMKRRHLSKRRRLLDADATVQYFCDTNVLTPVMRPGGEHWFDVDVLVDVGPSMAVWQDTAAEFVAMLQRHGAFRTVRRWDLEQDDGTVYASRVPGLRSPAAQVADPGARRLAVVLTDGIGPWWYKAPVWETIREWGRSCPVVLVSPLPQRLWPGTALGSPELRLRSHRPGAPNQLLDVTLPWWWPDDEPPRSAVPVPVLALGAADLAAWARMTMGAGGVETVGIFSMPPPGRAAGQSESAPRAAEDLVRRFRVSVSPVAYRLAIILSAVLSGRWEVGLARIVQEAALPESGHVHLAEVLIGGLVHQAEHSADQQEPMFEFVDGVAAVLRRSLTGTEALRLLQTLSGYLERATGQSSGIAALLVGQETDIAATGAFADLRVGAANLIDAMGLARAAIPVEAPRGDQPSTAELPLSLPAEITQAGPPAETEVMAALPDPNRSRAVLIGASTYRHLENLPAVRNDLSAFRDILIAPGLGGLAADSCAVIAESAAPIDVYRTLRQHAAAAEDMLLVYFSGHGWIGSRDELFLCLSETDPGELSHSALRYDDLRRVLADSPAAHKVVILDCSFGGRALASDGETNLVQLAGEGIYILTATGANDHALAPPGERHTAFSGALLDLLSTGIPGGPELLTFAQIYARLRPILASRNLPVALQAGSAAVAHLALTRNVAYTGPSEQVSQDDPADLTPADRDISVTPPCISSIPPHAEKAIAGRLLGLEALAPNISLLEAQGDGDLAVRFQQSLNWLTNEVLDDPDNVETTEEFLIRLTGQLRSEFSTFTQDKVVRAGSVLDELSDLVAQYAVAPYDPLMRVAGAVAETAANYYRFFQAYVPDSVWQSTPLNFSYTAGQIGQSFASSIHIQLWTEFEIVDNTSAQVRVRIGPRWLNQETVAAWPRLLMHEYIAHVPQGPFTGRRVHPDADDVFAEGWMDYIADRVLKDSLQRRGPSRALSDALMPSWIPLYEVTADRVSLARNSLADGDRTSAARFEGLTAARQLHDLLRRLPATAESADELLYKLSFSLNVSGFDNLSRVRFVTNVRLGLQRASRVDSVTGPLVDWAAGRIDSGDLFARIME